MHEKIEINHEYSDEILHKNNLQMDLALQITSKDQNVRSNSVQVSRIQLTISCYASQKRRTTSIYDACH